MKKDIGIIIPVFNQVFYTKQVLKSIKEVFNKSEQVGSLVVVVVDNNSSDETPKYLEGPVYAQSKDNLTFCYVISKENLGYGGGANKGIEFLQSNYSERDYLILNNDMILLEGCIDALIETAYSKENIGIVGGKLLFPDNTIQQAGAFLTSLGWGQHIGAGIPEEQYLDRDKVQEMEYVTGALLFIKHQAAKLLIEKEGHIFDERFFMYFEEVDLSYVLRKHGYKTIYTPYAKAIHFEGRS